MALRFFGSINGIMSEQLLNQKIQAETTKNAKICPVSVITDQRIHWSSMPSLVCTIFKVQSTRLQEYQTEALKNLEVSGLYYRSHSRGHTIYNESHTNHSQSNKKYISSHQPSKWRPTVYRRSKLFFYLHSQRKEEKRTRRRMKFFV